MSFTTGFTPAASDTPTTSLQKINSLLQTPSIPGFSIPAFDYIAITNVGSTNNLNTVVYKSGGASGTTVATLTLAYVGGTPVADDAVLASITKS